MDRTPSGNLSLWVRLATGANHILTTKIIISSSLFFPWLGAQTSHSRRVSESISCNSRAEAPGRHGGEWRASQMDDSTMQACTPRTQPALLSMHTRVSFESPRGLITRKRLYVNNKKKYALWWPGDWITGLQIARRFFLRAAPQVMARGGVQHHTPLSFDPHSIQGGGEVRKEGEEDTSRNQNENTQTAELLTYVHIYSNTSRTNKHKMANIQREGEREGGGEREREREEEKKNWSSHELNRALLKYHLEINLPLTFRDRVFNFQKFPMKFNFT